MKIELPFEIGERLYTPSYGKRLERVVCPECNGDKFLTLTLGNGEQYQLECHGCSGSIIDPSKGWVQIEHPGSYPEEFTARRFGIDDQGIWYSSSGPSANSYQLVRAENLYRTQAECQVACDKRNAEIDKGAQDRSLAHRMSKRRDLAWSVHYWRRQRAEAVADIERIDQRLKRIADKKKAS